MPLPSALQGALPETVAAWNALESAAMAQGIAFTLNDFGGVRTPADTALILQYRETDYAAALAADTIPADTTISQFRPIAPYGQSYHDYGAAFDVTAARADGRSTRSIGGARAFLWAPVGRHVHESR